MTNHLRFIHTADIHLGSYLHNTGVSPEIDEFLNQATYEAFKNICDAAIKYKVDFILLAGDLYDQEARSVEANRYFNEQCERLNAKGISIYIIAGNHDPLKDTYLLSQPENVYLFGSDKPAIEEICNQDGHLVARIVGQSYGGRAESRKMYSEFTLPADPIWNIALLHTQLDAHNPNYVPCTLSDLRERTEIDYWALGHIHQCQMISRREPVVCYPGIPQGRDFGELGIGGCMLVEATKKGQSGDISFKFVPTSPVVMRRIEVRIDGDTAYEPQNLVDLENLIMLQAEALLEEQLLIPAELSVPEETDIRKVVKGYVVQWIVTGRGEIHHRLMEQLEEIEKDLTATLRQRLAVQTPFIWTDSVVIRTGVPIAQLELLLEGDSIFKELKKTMASVVNDQALKEELISSLGQIWEFKSDHEHVNQERFQLNDELLQEILTQAEELILEGLLEVE